MKDRMLEREPFDYQKPNLKFDKGERTDNRVDVVPMMLEGPFFYKRGLTIYCPFDEIFDIPENKSINTFSLQKKRAYCNGIDAIVHYLNYFVTRFDRNKELIPAWYRIKGLIDSDIVYPFELFHRDIFNLIFTPSMVNNIKRMTKYNYYVSVESPKNTAYDAKYDALQVTHYHGFIFHCISVASKIVAPLITHYFQIEGYGDDKIDALLCDIIVDIPDKFSDTFNAYNKLYITTRSRILKDHGSDLSQWMKCRTDGIDAHRTIAELTNKLYVETFVKTKFEANVFSYIHSMLRKWVRNKKLVKFKFNNFTVCRTDGGGDDLSSFDKLEINNVKKDESSKIIANIALDDLINKLEKESEPIDIESDEFKYYETNLVLEDFQKTILRTYYSKYISPYYLNLGYRYDRVIKLVILMKRKLKSIGLYNLAIICTSQPDKLTSRTLNKKDSGIVLDSAMMKNIFNMKYNISKSIMSNSSSISVFVNNIINNNYIILDYDLRDRTGEEFRTSKEILSYEVTKFIQMI